MENIGEKLYSLRKKHGLSQEELSEKLGVSRQTISNWENDKVRLDAITASEICRIYSISMDELFFDCNKKETKHKPARKLNLLLYISLAVAAIISILSLIGLFVCNTDTVSSTIAFTSGTWLLIIAIAGMTFCGIVLFLLIKNNKQK